MRKSKSQVSKDLLWGYWQWNNISCDSFSSYSSALYLCDVFTQLLLLLHTNADSQKLRFDFSPELDLITIAQFFSDNITSEGESLSYECCLVYLSSVERFKITRILWEIPEELLCFNFSHLVQLVELRIWWKSLETVCIRICANVKARYH